MINERGRVLDATRAFEGSFSVRALTYDSSKDDDVIVIEPVVISMKVQTSTLIQGLSLPQLNLKVATNRLNVNIDACFARFMRIASQEMSMLFGDLDREILRKMLLKRCP